MGISKQVIIMSELAFELKALEVFAMTHINSVFVGLKESPKSVKQPTKTNCAPNLEPVFMLSFSCVVKLLFNDCNEVLEKHCRQIKTYWILQFFLLEVKLFS